MAQSDIKSLVSQLESHLNSSEIALKSTLKIHQNSLDEHLDDLFLSNTFDKRQLLSGITLIRQQVYGVTQQNDLEQIESKCLDEASARLRTYIEGLNDHIVKIVESESEEFLTVAQKLESFKLILSDLKDSVKDFHLNYSLEKSQLTQIFEYLLSEYHELKSMVDEKRRLERLNELQEMYSQLETKVKELKDLGIMGEDDAAYIELEECVRILSEIKKNAKEAEEPTINHQLAQIEKQIVEQAKTGLERIIKKSIVFKKKTEENDPDDHYFSLCEYTSFLRIFKLLDLKSLLYERLQILLLKPQINSFVKSAYDTKSPPFATFLSLLHSEILQGTLYDTLSITTVSETSEVSGYHFLRDCLWPVVIQTIDNSLAFIFSSANLRVFHSNYKLAKEFIKNIGDGEIGGELIQRFNVQTYVNVMVVEETERYQNEIERQYQETNEMLKPLHPITVEYAMKMISDDYYLEEVGDKMIKISIQFVVRQLNWIMDKIIEKKSMASERILFILEDLNKLHHFVKNQIFHQIQSRLKEAQPELENTAIQFAFIIPLQKELQLRFDHLVEPCLSSLASRISQRLVENMLSFKQIPSYYRMTSRPFDLSNIPPSQFLETILRPLFQLNDSKLFSQLSNTVKYKIYETALYNGMKELRGLIDDVISEEKKMHESLKKFKRDDNNGVISDYEKMQVQFFVDIKVLEQQIRILFGEESGAPRKFDRYFTIINETLDIGKRLYEGLGDKNEQNQ